MLFSRCTVALAGKMYDATRKPVAAPNESPIDRSSLHRSFRANGVQLYPGSVISGVLRAAGDTKHLNKNRGRGRREGSIYIYNIICERSTPWLPFTLWLDFWSVRLSTHVLVLMFDVFVYSWFRVVALSCCRVHPLLFDRTY